MNRLFYGFEEKLKILALQSEEQQSRAGGESQALYDAVADQVQQSKVAESQQSQTQQQPASQQQTTTQQPTDQSTAQSGSQQPAAQQQAAKQQPAKQQDTGKQQQQAKDKQEPSDKQQQPAKQQQAPKEQGDKTAQSKAEQVTTESVASYSLVMEGFFGEVVETGSRIVGPIADAVQWMAKLGITYTPKMAQFVYKNVIVTIGRMIGLMLNSLVRLAEYIERRINSFERMKNDVRALKEAVSQLKEKQNRTPDDQVIKNRFSQQKLCSQLIISGNPDLMAGAHAMTEFLDETIKHLGGQLRNELNAIDHLLAMSVNSDVQRINTVMKVRPFTGQLVRGGMEGYDTDNEFVEAYHHTKTLPGNVVLIGFLPSDAVNTLEEMKRAYNGASLFLGMDVLSFVEVRDLNYMDLEELSNFLDTLDELVTVCMNHQYVYEEVQRHQSMFQYKFKTWLANLFDTSSQVAMKDTLLEYIQMKLVIADKVYLPAAIDIHDYVAKYLANAMTFARENIKQF